ncbi:hypothetical protein C8J57DRAFT_1505947 [Mycena rebaudengoi]|nr:hypothetical protein C8J57DRAFT_1505947 [Mycena rebaudengoi]
MKRRDESRRRRRRQATDEDDGRGWAAVAAVVKDEHRGWTRAWTARMEDDGREGAYAHHTNDDGGIIPTPLSAAHSSSSSSGVRGHTISVLCSASHSWGVREESLLSLMANRDLLPLPKSHAPRAQHPPKDPRALALDLDLAAEGVDLAKKRREKGGEGG